MLGHHAQWPLATSSRHPRRLQAAAAVIIGWVRITVQLKHTHTYKHTHKEGQAIATPSQTSCTLELSSSCGPLNTKYAVPSTSPILACFGLFVFFQCVQSDFLFWESDTRSLFFVVFLLFLLFFFFFCFLLWLLLFLVLVDETNNLVDVVAGPLNVGTPLRNITPRTGKEHPSSNLVNGPLDGKWTRARE